MPRLWAQPPGAVGTMYMWCGVVVQIDDAKGWLLRCHELDILHVLMRECAWRVRNLTRVAQLHKEAIPHLQHEAQHQIGLRAFICLKHGELRLAVQWLPRVTDGPVDYIEHCRECDPLLGCRC